MISKFTILALILLSPFSVYAVAGTIPVNIEGNTYEIQYDVEGMEILNVQADLDFVSLIFDVDVPGTQGIMEIIFDRSVFDSTIDGNDVEFIVIADGDEPNFEEILTTENSRTLRIELPSGTDEVEIIGTQFGNLQTTEPETTEPETTEPETTEPETTEPETTEPETTEPETTEPETTEPETTAESKPTEEEKPKIQCGPGTILKDGMCVLDERCGPGTILKDGVCVLTQSNNVDGGTAKELVVGAIAAFLIALGIIIILYLISKGARRHNN